ncbi:MAG: maleylpyruvate isomerase family mycothiol-dependent enzyme [Dermatophilaceae bacterium]
MTVHPTAPTDLAGMVDAWAQTVRSVLDLGRTMRPEDADQPTDCPGWTVFDQIAHIASAEAGLAGEPVADLDVSGRAHVRSPFGERIERLVESRRGRSLDEVLDEFEDRLAERLAVYGGPDVTAESEVPGPFGRTTLLDLLGVRTFDIWTHEQDIREALGRPGGLDTPAAAVSVTRFLDALPRIVARDAGVEPGQAVVLDITGPTVARAGVRVEEQDGGPVGIPLFSGAPEQHPDVVATTLTMSTQVVMRLAGGRRDPADVHVVVHGDADVARRVLRSLAVTP